MLVEELEFVFGLFFLKVGIFQLGDMCCILIEFVKYLGILGVCWIFDRFVNLLKGQSLILFEYGNYMFFGNCMIIGICL